MLHIKYWGHSCFEVWSSDTEYNIVFDPFSEHTARFALNTKARIVLCSHDHADHNAWRRVITEKSVCLIGFVGVREIGEVRVLGVELYHDASLGAIRGKNSAYVVEIGDFVVAHLGDVGHILGEDQIIELLSLGRIDVLFVPVGGKYTIGPNQAVTLIMQLRPRIVIPMHYRHRMLTNKELRSLEPIESFIDAASGAFHVSKILDGHISIAPSSMPVTTQIYVLGQGRE